MSTSSPNPSIRVLVTWTIRQGQTEIFMDHAKGLVEAMKKGEPGCRATEIFLGPDGRTAKVYEEYADAKAVAAHLASPVVGAYMPKFMACADGPTVELLGDTPPALTEAYKGFGATISRPTLGFTR